MSNSFQSDPSTIESDASDDADPSDGRDETLNEKMDRNWSDILQELRVTQTGTQILTGFLLAIAFQPKFDMLTDFQRGVYLFLVMAAVTTTALGLGAGQPASRAVPATHQVPHRPNGSCAAAHGARRRRGRQCRRRVVDLRRGRWPNRGLSAPRGSSCC